MCAVDLIRISTISFKRSQMKQTITLLQRFNSILFLFLLTVTIHNAEAQCTSTCGANLVPNPSFEATTTFCGSTGILYTDKSPVQSWFGVSSSTGSSSGITPDNFNDNCAGNSTDNCGSGSGSVGFFTTGARESVQAKLTSPLIAGHRYCFSMKVLSNFPNTSSDGIGAWFHNKGKIDIDAMNGGSSFLGAGTTLNAVPQVQNPSNTMIGGTCKTVTGTFCAVGGEQWIVISNFRTNANTHLTGINGYLVIDELSLKEADCLVISSITTTADSVCPGACATLKANPSGGGGAGSYTYLWSPGGETTQSISACPTVNATEYKCTVSSSVGCSATLSIADSVMIYFKKYLLTPTISTSGITTLCSGDSVKLTCSAAPNYLWSPGNSPKQSITVGVSGVYTVTVKHPYSSCNTTSASTTVTVNALPVLNLSGLINTSSSCDVNDGSLKGVTATGAPILTYSWNSTPVQTTPDLVNVGPGVYTLTVTDGKGCKKSTTGTIVNKPAPIPPTLKAASPAICVGTNTILFVTGADPTFIYFWTDPSSTVISSNDTVFINNAQLKDGGVYKVTATKFGCTGASASLTLTVNPLPVIDTTTIISHQTSCSLKDGSITGIKVSGAPILKYAWDGGPQTTTTPDLTGAGIGTHTLVVTDGNGCVQSITAKVWNKDTPDSATVKTTSAVICEGLTTILYVSPSDPTVTYTWITPAGDKITNDSIILFKAQIKDAGTYTITATKANCTSLPAYSTLIVNPAALSQKVTLTKSTICEGDTTTIDAAIHIAGITYNVYTQAAGGAPIGVAPLKVSPKVTTKYYMEATTSSDCRQLTARDTATVIVNPAPVVPPPIASNAVICEGKSTTLDVQSPVTGVTYNVYDALTGGTLLGHTPFTVTLVKTTTFYIEAQTTKGCVQTTGRTPITITVNPTPAGPKITVQGSNNNTNFICDGSSAILTSSIPTGIIWSTQETTASITVKTAGTYWVYFTDSKGCASLKDSVNIKVNMPPKVDASNYKIDTVRCNAIIGGIHGIVINSGTAPFTYKWYETGDPTKTVSTDLILQGVASGKYTLIVTDKNGCSDQLSNIFIPTKGGIVAHLSSNPTTGFLPLDVILTTNTSGVGKPIDYVWYLDGRLMGTTDGKTNTFPIKGLPFGEHVLQVNVRDTNGCKSVDYLTIFVNSGIHFNDVNIFTPNNDGKNDILIFPLEGIKSIHGKIYDRWGLKLFEWSDGDTGWDGKAESGGDVPEGTYYYIINYTDIYDGPPHTASGFVQLMRK
jgi:gliding motility-associated-like protein